MGRLILGLMAASALASPAWAAGNAAHGKEIFVRCMACHVATEPKNRIGPTLYGVVGRKAGSVEGFNYSEGMKKAGEDGLVWTEANLDKYLSDPAAMVPNNHMMFPGLKKEQDRQDVIAYLKSVGPKN